MAKLVAGADVFVHNLRPAVICDELAGQAIASAILGALLYRAQVFDELYTIVDAEAALRTPPHGRRSATARTFPARR